MPGSDGGYTFDLNRPHPNVDIDTMRQTVLQTLAGIDDTYWLSDLLFTLLDAALADLGTALTDLAAAAVEREQCRADINALTARLDTSEARLPAVEPQPEPDPEVP